MPKLDPKYFFNNAPIATYVQVPELLSYTPYSFFLLF